MKSPAADGERIRAHPVHLLFVINFAFFCLQALAGTLYVAWFGRESWSWPSAEGELLNVQEGEDDSKEYVLAIRYRYRVDGVQHDSTQFQVGREYPGVHTRDERPAELTQSRLRVYYRPQVLGISVLRRGAPPTNVVFLLVITLFLAGTLWSVVFPRWTYELNDRLRQGGRTSRACERCGALG
jgi:Protein of unknown function (DUF3592)